MIYLSYRPIRFETKDKQDFEYPFNRDLSLKEYLDKTGIDYNDCDIIINGKVETKLNKHLDNDDNIIITPSIKDVFSIGAAIWSGIMTLVNTAWTFALTHPFLFCGAVLTSSYSLYSALTVRQNKPNFGSIGDGFDESSATYGWDGIRTVQEVGIPVKLVCGKHRTGGNIINQYISTDGDKQYLNLLIAAGEGEIESISDIKINEQPVANFEGIDIEYRYGTNDQTVIPNFVDLHNVYNINVNLEKDDPYIYTTIDNDVEAFEINFTLPAGLWQADSNGAISSWSVTYKVEYKVHTDTTYTDLGSTTIDGKSRTALRRVFRKSGLMPAQYDIRITRVSDNSSLEPQRAGDLYLTSIDEIKTDDLAYPDTALISVRALATDQLSGQTPNITFVEKGLKIRIPNVLTALGGDPVDWEDYYYDPDDEVFRLFSDDSELYWDEISYVIAWSANPIWHLRNLLVNTRYGLGEYIDIDSIDEAEMLEMALYCEEKIANGAGGFEKRFRLDIVLDSASKTPDMLSQICATFRAFSFYSNNGFSFRIDKPENPVQVFGMGNIIKKDFAQAWKSRTEIYNMIQVQMNDKELDYVDETVSVMDEATITAGDPINTKTLRLFIANKSYAIREARYALWVSKYINRSIQIRCGIDAIACKAGDVINISHDVPQWGFSGRVKSGSTTTSVNIDQNVEVEIGKTYKLMVRFADDTIEEKTVTNAVGSHSTITLSEAFSQEPKAYDVYSFGEVNKVVKPFRVVSISREKEGECVISAIEYNESVYDDSGIVLPTNNYSSLTYTIPNVTDLTLTERLIKLADGKIENAIDVWFNKPQLTGYSVRRYMKAKVYISDDDGESWIERGETAGNHFAIIGDLVELIKYKVCVASVGDTGDENAKSTSPQASITLIGKTAFPSDVSSFLVNQSRDRLYFAWTNILDVDLDSYEIRFGKSWESGYIIASKIKSNRLIILDFRTGVGQKFFIKAIDTSGNYSENATEATLTIENIPFTNIIESYQEQPTWAGEFDGLEQWIEGNILLEDGSNMLTEDGDSFIFEVGISNVIISGGLLSGTYTTPVRDLGYLATFKIGVEAIITLTDNATWQDFGEQTFEDISETYRFIGAERGDRASFEIRTSEDNITWTDWSPFQTADYYCRYFQLRMTLVRDNETQEIICSAFNYFGDLPDIDDKTEGIVTVANDGADIVFTKEFHKVYGVHITITSGDGVYAKISGLDLTGCNVKLYDEEGVAKTGDFLCHAHGI